MRPPQSMARAGLRSGPRHQRRFRTGRPRGLGLPRLAAPTIGLQRDGGREETTRRRAAQTPGARAASLSIDKRYRFGITDDAHVHQRGYAHLLIHPATRSWAALPTRFTSICWPRHPLGTEFSSTKIRGDCRSRVAVGVKLLLLLLFNKARGQASAPTRTHVAFPPLPKETLRTSR